MIVNTIKKLDKLYDKFNELMITEYKEKPSVNVTFWIRGHSIGAGQRI